MSVLDPHELHSGRSYLASFFLSFFLSFYALKNAHMVLSKHHGYRIESTLVYAIDQSMGMIADILFELDIDID